jgi:hypothetical protein
LLLQFNSASLRGIADGMSIQKLGSWCKVEKFDFLQKIEFLGRSQPLSFWGDVG